MIMPDGFEGYGWDGYLDRARRDLDWTTLEREEIDYKKDTERLLRDVATTCSRAATVG